jgi:hypothetical protein
VHYDSEYADVQQNMREYSPEDSEEEDLVQNPENHKGPNVTENRPLLGDDLSGNRPAGEASGDDLRQNDVSSSNVN